MWFAVIIYFLISICLILYANKASFKNYTPVFCRDIRAQLGMFAYKSDVEEKRAKLNRPDSKF